MRRVRLPTLDLATAGPVGLDRRTAFALDLSSWIALIVMGSLGISMLDGTGQRVVAAMLCLIFGALDLAGARTEFGARHQGLMFALQTAVVVALLATHPEFQDPFAFLFVVLSVRVVLVFGLKRGAWWVGLFWVLSSIAAIWTHGRDGAFSVVFNLGVYPLCGMVGFALAALGRSTTERAQALAELQRAQAQLQRGAVDEERRRLGRDLHDSVKQQVFAATMQLGAARALLPDQPERALSAVERAEQATRSAGSELNLVIHELRSEDLDHGLREALNELAGGWSRQLGVPVDRTIDRQLEAPLPVAHGLLRIAQESLANISRHAQASHVGLTLSGTDTHLMLTITDNGGGFRMDESPSMGVGLNSMEERARTLGGELTITSAPGRGTAIRARVPREGHRD